MFSLQFAEHHSNVLLHPGERVTVNHKGQSEAHEKWDTEKSTIPHHQNYQKISFFVDCVFSLVATFL